MLPSSIPAPSADIQAVGSVLYDILSAVKAGQTFAQALAACEADALAAATSGVQNIGTDIKAAHNQVYLGWSIAQVYETA